MKSVVLDTNVVLSFITDRDPGQQRAAARLFDAAAGGDLRLVLPQVVLIEIVYVLENLYRMPSAEVAAILDDLLAMPRVVPENEVAWRVVLKLWPSRVRGFADAVLVAVARAGGHALASFDRRLVRRVGRLGTEPYPLG